jgi:hypothetical protein
MNSFEKITNAVKNFEENVKQYYNENGLIHRNIDDPECEFAYVEDISNYDIDEVNRPGFVCSDLSLLFPEEKVNDYLTDFEYGSFLFNRIGAQQMNRNPCALQLKCELDADLSYNGRELVRMAELHFAEFTYIYRRHCEAFDFIFITDTRDLIIVSIIVRNYYGGDDCVGPFTRIGGVNNAEMHPVHDDPEIDDDEAKTEYEENSDNGDDEKSDIED